MKQFLQILAAVLLLASMPVDSKAASGFPDKALGDAESKFLLDCNLPTPDLDDALNVATALYILPLASDTPKAFARVIPLFSRSPGNYSIRAPPSNA